MVAWNHVPTPEYLTASQAARLAGVSRQSIWLAIKAGDLPAQMVGCYNIIQVDDLTAWMQKRKEEKYGNQHTQMEV